MCVPSQPPGPESIDRHNSLKLTLFQGIMILVFVWPSVTNMTSGSTQRKVGQWRTSESDYIDEKAGHKSVDQAKVQLQQKSARQCCSSNKEDVQK
jgi:hypothetical protein